MKLRVVAATIIALFVTIGCSGGVPSGSPLSPGASGSSGGVPLLWSRHVTGPDAPILGSIIPREGGLLAVGLAPAGGGIWSSADGIVWTPVVPPATDLVLSTLAAGGRRFIAGGRMVKSDGSGTGQILVSDDGTSWTPAATQPTGSGSIDGLAFRDGQWVAIGSGNGSNPGEERVIWTSTDGMSWQHVAVAKPGRIVAVTAGDAGFVAVGEGPSGQSGVPAAVILTSADGARWTSLADAAPFGPTTLATATFGNGQYMIGGAQFQLPEGAFRPVAWRSADARTWEPITFDDEVLIPGGSDGKPVFAEGAFLLRIARTPDAWIASGVATDARTDTMAQDVAIWLSADGRTFRREPHLRAFEAGEGTSLNSAPAGLAAWRSGVIVSGQTTGGLATVWLSPAQPGGTEPAPRQSQAVGPSIEASPCCDATPAPMAP